MHKLVFLMCFSCAVDTVSDMLNVVFGGTDVEASEGEIEVDGVGSSSSLRSANLFEEGAKACDDCGDNFDLDW